MRAWNGDIDGLISELENLFESWGVTNYEFIPVPHAEDVQRGAVLYVTGPGIQKIVSTKQLISSTLTLARNRVRERDLKLSNAITDAARAYDTDWKKRLGSDNVIEFYVSLARSEDNPRPTRIWDVCATVGGRCIQVEAMTEGEAKKIAAPMLGVPTSRVLIVEQNPSKACPNCGSKLVIRYPGGDPENGPARGECRKCGWQPEHDLPPTCMNCGQEECDCIFCDACGLAFEPPGCHKHKAKQNPPEDSNYPLAGETVVGCPHRDKKLAVFRTEEDLQLGRPDGTMIRSHWIATCRSCLSRAGNDPLRTIRTDYVLDEDFVIDAATRPH